MDRVLLKQAHVLCCGNARDESIIAEVASALPRIPTLSAAPRKEPLKRIRDSEAALRECGREHRSIGDTCEDKSQEVRQGGMGEVKRQRRERRAESLPTELPIAITAALKQANAMHVATALPISVDQLHARQRGAVGSTQRSKLDAWLESTAGKEWQLQRAAMYKADGPNPDVNPEASGAVGLEKF